VDRPAPSRVQWGALVGLVVLLALLALGATQVTSRLLPTMGITVVAAGLFLPPRMTAFVGVAAVGLAIPVALSLDEEYEQVRIANLVIAAVLAFAASWFLQRRIDRIKELGRTQAAILASIPDAVVVLDAQGRVAQANAGLARLVPGAVLGDRLHPHLGHVLADGSPCPGGCPLDGRDPGSTREIPVEDERITRQGHSVPVAYTCGRMAEGGIVLSMRDVSSRVRAEHDRRVLLQAAVRQEEQTRLLRALEAPGNHAVAQVPGVTSDIWSVGAEGGAAASDLVDLSTLPDGRVLILLVDSGGRGVRTRRDAWMVLHVCRAHMAAGAPLAEMIALGAQTLAWDEDTPRAGVLGVIVDPANGYVQAVLGGCPPALIVHAQGTARWIEAAGQGLGSERPGSHSVVSAELNPGDSLLLYSDGVVDATDDVIEGLSTLRSVAVALRNEPSPGWSHRVLSSLQGNSRPLKDATLVLVRLGEQS
jgi:PAS domain-containing protein